MFKLQFIALARDRPLALPLGALSAMPDCEGLDAPL